MDDSIRVKDAARGRWVDLLSELGSIPTELLDGHHRPCPKCGGTDRFRLIDEEEGAVLCNQCFRERNGDGLAALQWMTGKTFPEVLALVASRVGVEIAQKKKRGRPRKDAGIELTDWSEDVVKLWCGLHKPGVSTEAVQANGGRLARWLGAGQTYRVIALPIRGATSTAPRGWAMYNVTGRELVSKSGAKKVLCTYGSKTGWLGDVDQAKGAQVIWKLEGPSDMLALWTAMRDAMRDAAALPHCVLSNPFGSSERPKTEALEILAGKTVVVCHDRDLAGQEGAQRWAVAIARVAAEVRILTLPEGPWKDVRDWLVAGGSFLELRELARAAPVLTPAQPPTEDGEDWEEAENCPSRLAVEFLQSRPGRVRYWRGESYRWADGRWRRLLAEEHKAEIVRFLREEFHRLNAAIRAEAKHKADELPCCHKITRGLTWDVQAAVDAYSLVPPWLDWGSELDLDADGRSHNGSGRHWIAFQNGILDLDALLDGEPVELQELRPEWWSPHILPYDFAPGAPLGPYWERILRENLEGNEDLATVLQEWMGYCLLPWTDLAKCLILEGEGANGKSVYCAALEALVGPQNCSHVGIEQFGQRFALAPTLGKLLNIAAEVGEIDKMAEGVFKAFVSGQTISIDRKGKEPISAASRARLVIATNNLPRFHDRSGGIWRRLLVVTLTYVVPEGRRILGMDKPGWWSTGPGSQELSGLFNWALEGLARLRVQGRFTDVSSVQQRVADYRTESNPAAEFLHERYRTGDPVYCAVACSEVYSEYATWCRESGYRPLGERQFGREVHRAYRSVRRSREGGRDGRRWVYSGLSKSEK